MLLVTMVTGAWADNLTKDLSVDGYELKGFYDFKTNTPAVLPTTGDLRYREDWGLFNFGGGDRTGVVEIPVQPTNLLIIQDKEGYQATVEGGIAVPNTELSEQLGFQVFEITTPSKTVTFKVQRLNKVGGFISAALVLKKQGAIDLDTDYEAVKTVTFNNGTPNGTNGGVDILRDVNDKLSVKAYETGNKRQQDLYAVTSPAEAVGWIGVQATNAQDGKGWWYRYKDANNSGLWSYNAERAAAVYGSELRIGRIVVIECTQDPDNVITLTNADGNPDGTFVYEKMGNAYFCTITSNADAHVGFCGKKSAGYIKSISIYKSNNELPAYQSTVDFSALSTDDINEIPEDLTTGITDAYTLVDALSSTTVTISASGDADAPNKYNVTENGAEKVVTLELNGGTITFDAHESRTLRKVTFYYDEWNDGNVAEVGNVEESAGARRAEGAEGDETNENGFEINSETQTATWAGLARRLVVSFAGKSVIKKIVIEYGERVGEGVTIDLASGKDIAKEVNAIYAQNPYVGGITVNLEKGGMYTVSKTIYISKPFVINGAGGAVIDASSNAGPMIQLSELPEIGLNAAGAYEISEVTLKDLTIVGVKNRLFYADRQRYLIKKISVDNSAIHIDGTSPRAIFDFYCGGNVEDLSIVNSTLWADPSNAQRGGLFNSQSGQNVEELGGKSQKFSILNSTLYNISYGMTQMLHRDFSQPLLTFELKDNVIANSGEKGRFLLGLNGGAQSEKSTWIVSGNAFSFDGEDTGAEEVASTGISEAALLGDVTFSDAATGDFHLSIYDNAFDQQKGDPRWLQVDANSLIVEVADGKDIADEYVTAKGDKNPGNVLIRLAKGGKYTMNSGLVIGGNLIIKGDAEEAATIDAAALEAPFVKMSETPAVAAVNKTDGEGNVTLLGYHVNQVKLLNVNISNLSQQLFSCNKQQYLIKALTVDNSIVGIKGAVKKTLFDFAGNGNTEHLTVSNSTLWADAATEWQNGGFFSSQSGKETVDLGGSEELLTIKNSTLYNICNGKTMNTLRKNNQKYQGYEIEHNVVVNCGKKNEFLVGLAGGRINNKDIWTAGGNIINYEVADEEGNVTLTDIGVDEASKSGLAAPAIKGLAVVKNAAEGDFLLALGCEANELQKGDPRWVRIARAIYLEPADGSDIAALVEAEYATLKPREYVSGTIILLADGGKYKATKAITLYGSLIVEGNKTTIDASELAEPLFQMTNEPVLDPVPSGQYVIAFPMLIQGITVTGLTKALFADGGKGYCYDTFMIDNCVFQYATQENVVLNMSASMAVNLMMSRNTFYSSVPGKANFIAMSGKRPWQTTGYEDETGKFTCSNNTFFNVAKSKQFMNTNTLKGQRYLYEFNSNIFVDVSNKKIYGNMTNNAKQLTTDEQNTYLFDGEFFSEPNYNGDAGLQTDPSFADAANGDFTIGAGTQQAEYQTGDPRWLVEYVPTAIESLKGQKMAEGEWYTIQGIRVEKPTKGLYIHNGKTVVVK